MTNLVAVCSHRLGVNYYRPAFSIHEDKCNLIGAKNVSFSALTVLASDHGHSFRLAANELESIDFS
jgi:hypothetical protein